ncbi:uncharacterized protein LOC127900828 [Citrus sinensis]|uniref:uncharacterized protein LOC127900828 n=1 Tax=Citrus sinensis TaxID=2711 RepID=UPI002277DA6F|nr:uncharacterized protein LOC127900828 [Citrus sinensis]
MLVKRSGRAKGEQISASIFWRRLARSVMDVSRNDALGGDNETVETITLREIANEARERMIQDRLERMEKQMETLKAILHELRDERRRDCETTVVRDEAVAEPSLRRRRIEEIPPPVDQPYGVHPQRSAGQIPEERVVEGKDQSRSGLVLKIDARGLNIDEGELRRQLHNAKQERDQMAARNPDHALELEGEVRRLGQVMDEIQGKRKPPSWRIMLDEESPLSAEIMSTIIPRDFRFPDLKYSGTSDPLVHIERFNDMKGVQGLTPAQRCRMFPLTPEGRVRDWYRKLPRGSIRGYEQMYQELAEQFRGAVAPEDDMMELMGMKQEEHKYLRDFVKRYHQAVLDLGAFNHPQALRGLKKGVRIGRLWYNFRSPIVQNYLVGYEQAKRDIEIEEEKMAKIKSEQLRRKEKRTLGGSGSGKRAGESSAIGGISARSRPYPMTQRPPQSQHSRAQPQCPTFPERQREFWQMAAHPHHNAPRVLHAVNSRDGRPNQLPTILARDDIHNSRAVQLIDQSLAYKQYTLLKVSMEELNEVLFNLPTAKRAKVRQVPIRWTDDDEEGVLYSHEDALVIKAMVASKEFRRLLVDTGSSVDILFKSALDDMGIADMKLERTNTSLKGFGGGRLTPMGIVELPITVGAKPSEKTVMLDFVVVEEKSPY